MRPGCGMHIIQCSAVGHRGVCRTAFSDHTVGFAGTSWSRLSIPRCPRSSAWTTRSSSSLRWWHAPAWWLASPGPFNEHRMSTQGSTHGWGVYRSFGNHWTGLDSIAAVSNCHGGRRRERTTVGTLRTSSLSTRAASARTPCEEEHLNGPSQRNGHFGFRLLCRLITANAIIADSKA